MRQFIALLGAAALGISIASAADMPVKAPIGVAYNWTGFYVGAVGTYGWGNSEHCQIGFAPACLPNGPFTNEIGWAGGGTVGYNWERNNWVLGAEGDWSWGKIKGSSPAVVGFNCGIGSTCDTWISSIGTARGRVGYAFDRFLPFLTAGAAFSDLHGAIGTPPARSTGSTTMTNFVWGVGLEYAFRQNFSAKIEYLNIMRMGDFVYDTVSACGVGTPCYVHVGSVNLVRFGLNYRFGGT